MTISEHRTTCGENFQDVDGAVNWCPVCGAIQSNGAVSVLAPQLVPALWRVWGELTDNDVLPDPCKPETLLENITAVTWDYATAHRVAMEAYAGLHAELVELRKHRDLLIESNNREVEARRAAERQAEEHAEANRRAGIMRAQIETIQKLRKEGTDI